MNTSIDISKPTKVVSLKEMIFDSISAAILSGSWADLEKFYHELMDLKPKQTELEDFAMKQMIDAVSRGASQNEIMDIREKLQTVMKMTNRVLDTGYDIGFEQFKPKLFELACNN